MPDLNETINIYKEKELRHGVSREAIMARLEKLMGEGVTHNIFKQLFIL